MKSILFVISLIMVCANSFGQNAEIVKAYNGDDFVLFCAVSQEDVSHKDIWSKISKGQYEPQKSYFKSQQPVLWIVEVEPKGNVSIVSILKKDSPKGNVEIYIKNFLDMDLVSKKIIDNIDLEKVLP